MAHASSRLVSFGTLAFFALALATAACSIATESASPAEPPTAESDDELIEAATAHPYAGAWANIGAAPKGDFLSFTLRDDGTYEGVLGTCPAGATVCPEIVQIESGSYKVVVKKSGVDRIRFAPTGARARLYTIAFAPTVAVVGAPRAIELTRSGRTQTFTSLDDAAIDAGPAPSSCGAVTCAADQVCCNPLAGICAAPGDVCAQ